MSTQLHFDLLLFAPLNWTAFKCRYRGVVQSVVEWDRIHHPKMGLQLLKGAASSVWYRKGDWRDGEPRKMCPGKVLALVRLPAVKWHGRFLILDGCHRMTEVQPAIVLLDWFQPRLRDSVYLNDLFNRYHQ